MQKSIFFLAALFFSAAATAQSGETPQFIEFEGKTWRVGAQDARIAQHLGRRSLSISGGRAWLDDAAFQNGVIEFDIAYDETTGFAGAGWRAGDDGNYEEIYLRAHLDQKPDAVQYTPVFNRLSGWQIYADGNAQTTLKHKFDDWNRVKIVVENDQADLYFNSDAPVMHIPDLKGDFGAGGVNLRGNGPDGFVAHFSNVVIRPLRDGETVIGAPKETPAAPEGLIAEWRVSSPFSETAVADILRLSQAATSGLEWKTLAAETNGVANLAKLAGRRDGADTVFVRLKLNSAKAQMKKLRFGYSDRARIYLNGKRVYSGDAGWRARDYRFLGTVGFFDSVGLDLKKGDNELLVAVSETFGGWAWAGAMEDLSGLEMTN